MEIITKEMLEEQKLSAEKERKGHSTSHSHSKRLRVLEFLYKYQDLAEIESYKVGRYIVNGKFIYTPSNGKWYNIRNKTKSYNSRSHKQFMETYVMTETKKNPVKKENIEEIGRASCRERV